MSLEDILIGNVKDNYNKALMNKVYLDDLMDKRLQLNIGNNKSLYIFGGNSNRINLLRKCNHIFMYNCNDIILRIDDCVSGITCINCHDCKLLFNRTPLYNIEISNSTNMNLRSMFFNMPIIHKGVSMNVIKNVCGIVYEYYKVNSGYFSNWNYNFFNF